MKGVAIVLCQKPFLTRPAAQVQNCSAVRRAAAAPHATVSKYRYKENV